MSMIDLKHLAARESEQVEWKENVADVHDVVETLVAFANDWSNLGGGYVVCGARESKDEHGFQKMLLPGLTAARFKEVEGRVGAMCREKVEPPITPGIEELPAENPDRRILVFVMPATENAHSFRRKADSGKYYIRVGRETREARNGLMRELLVRKGASKSWDHRPCAQATLDDIDLVAFRDTLQRMKLWDPSRSIEDYFSQEFRLSALVPPFAVREPLTNEVRPFNYTLLLFGREIQRFYPGAYTTFSAYPGVDRGEPYAERQQFAGNLLDQIDRLLDRLNTEAYDVLDKSNGSLHLVKYPQRALKEALVNALAHRDYESNQPARVTVFSDRIEIHSPGSLPTAVQTERFRAGQATPYWRNQALAFVLNRLQLAEAEGQGIATILRSMREEGCPDPEFEITPVSLTCVLPAHPRHALMRELLDVERAILVRKPEDALRHLAPILERDPFNVRAVELFCEIHGLMGDARPVLDFVQRHRDRLDDWSAHAQLVLAEALPHEDTDGRVLARQLLTRAARGQFEENEARRIAVGLRKIGEDQQAIDFIERQMELHSSWKTHSTFLQLRARSWMELAKRCVETGRDQKASSRIRRKAWDECRRLLGRAERDLNLALDHSSDARELEWLRRDFDFLDTMKQVARKPAKSSTRRSRRG